MTSGFAAFHSAIQLLEPSDGLERGEITVAGVGGEIERGADRQMAGEPYPVAKPTPLISTSPLRCINVKIKDAAARPSIGAVEKFDYVEQLIAQWNRQRPEIDVGSMGVIGRISRISRLLERHIDGLFAAHGLQGGRFDVLAALVRAGEPYRLTPTQLYNSFLVSSGAITNRIDRLVDEGLVTRGSNASDRRSMPVQLTEAGRERLDAALVVHVKNEEELLASLDRRERELLGEILRRWLIALGDHHQPAESLSDDSGAPST